MKVYGARTIKRERRSREQIEQLDRQIIEVLAEDHPQSVRHVFYRMTNPRLPEPVEKSERGYRHVQHRVKELRRIGRVPYGWITDATRRGYFVNTYRNAGDFLRSMSGLYRADLWQGSDFYCEVWTESRSTSGRQSRPKPCPRTFCGECYARPSKVCCPPMRSRSPRPRSNQSGNISYEWRKS